MKRIFTLFMCFLMALTFTACDDYSNAGVADEKPKEENNIEQQEDIVEIAEEAEEYPTLRVRTDEIKACEYKSDSGKLLYHSTYPEVTLSDEDALKYPELSKALREFVEEEKETAVRGEAEAKAIIDETIENYPEYDMELYDTKVARIRRGDDTVLSIQLYYNGYSGGAHGFYSNGGVTFDTKTGEKISFSDVVVNKSAFLDAVAEKLDKRREELCFGESTNIRELIDGENMFEWTLENDSVTVYFAPYVIAPFAAGAPSVTISAAEYPGLINEKYISDSECFAMELFTDTFAYDVTGDGVADRIMVYDWWDYDGENEVQSLKVMVNEKEYSDKLSFEDAEATFVKTADGKFYIYVDVTYENSGDILCFELSECIKKIDVLEDLFIRRDDTGDGSPGPNRRWVITNPESFFLEDYEQNNYEYRVGKNGIPERKDK
ncbi:MAG: DUF3298 and DUF4163 domain-containing protein [Ruminococcaceae bacterium]|nr:DUF3298 and DUF4163 domain-containing protein [Oscillospiraceae bacterium]